MNERAGPFYTSKIDLNRVADGGILKTLDNGLHIIRRRKHEWLSGLHDAPAKKRELLTGKVWGSKFLDHWTLESLTERIEAEINSAGRTLSAQNPNPLDIKDKDPVGLANGRQVHIIRIVCDGRYIHAYPIEESQ